MNLRSEEMMVVIIISVIISLIIMVAMTYGIFLKTAFTFLNVWDLYCPIHIYIIVP